MTIHDRIFLYRLAYKNHKRNLAIGLLILLIGSLGVAVGYIAGQNTHRTPIIIKKCSQEAI